MQQTIRFIKSADGTRLAVGTSGQGAPLVKAANWLSHLEFDWQSPVWRHWFRFLSAGRQLIRFDPRGCGLSDWDVADLSHAAQVADLEAIVAASDLETFPLLGVSQGGAACIEYAVRHPERVSKLLLYGCYAEGWAQRGEDSRRHGEALVELIRQGWGQENPAFRLLFASLFIPDATTEQVRWFSDLMRTTTEPEIAARIIESFGQINVRSLLPLVKVPTVVVHARNDARIPFDQGRLLAAEIPNASFVTLESRNHILIENEPAWARFCETFNDWMGVTEPVDVGGQAIAPVDLVELTARENAILRLVAQGAANGEIARRLFISEKTVRNHLTNIFEKLGVDSRARAIVVARDRGVA
ncbi:alpha/beta fold hydrolase [Peristeroidobacter agariperforans]|uniref:alpha/beta fold hydrolase n=1 Tax=Peristeroidobacter agariperforans TaxID=268404 RepID=UPI00101C64F2|nr:alpha/beta fold hydrolase [Peristeroidobacter agariperforans]